MPPNPSAGQSNKRPVCVVFGAGFGNGRAIGKRFAKDGYSVVLLGRAQDDVNRIADEIAEECQTKPHCFAIDARDETAVVGFFQHDLPQILDKEDAELCTVVHNIGPFKQKGLVETTTEDMLVMWENSALSAFIVGREAVKALMKNSNEPNEGRGCIIFTGASGSWRGKSNFAAFSAAMQAKRAICQAMAREYQPEGIHVVSVIIDGVINPEKTSTSQEEEDAVQKSDMERGKRFLEPESVADAYFYLAHQQRPDAWTQEMDLRPCTETF